MRGPPPVRSPRAEPCCPRRSSSSIGKRSRRGTTRPHWSVYGTPTGSRADSSWAATARRGSPSPRTWSARRVRSFDGVKPRSSLRRACCIPPIASGPSEIGRGRSRPRSARRCVRESGRDAEELVARFTQEASWTSVDAMRDAAAGEGRELVVLELGQSPRRLCRCRPVLRPGEVAPLRASGGRGGASGRPSTSPASVVGEVARRDFEAVFEAIDSTVVPDCLVSAEPRQFEVEGGLEELASPRWRKRLPFARGLKLHGGLSESTAVDRESGSSFPSTSARGSCCARSSASWCSRARRTT